jgi:hypothetical protein
MVEVIVTVAYVAQDMVPPAVVTYVRRYEFQTDEGWQNALIQMSEHPDCVNAESLTD